MYLFFAQAEHGAAAEEEGGSFLVSPDVGLMIWTLLVFGITLFLLAKYVFPRIGEALDRRQRAIEDSIDHAERTRQEADELLAEYRQRLADARAQADEIVARARKTGEEVESHHLADAKKKQAELIDAARRDIEQETKRAIQEIRKEVADLTILATERVTRKTLTAEDQRKLVEEALAEFDFSLLGGGTRAGSDN